MKSFIAASVASVVLSLGGFASAAPPAFHQNYGHSSNYGYPSNGYGTVQNYGGYQPYQSYPTYPQYGQSWNTSVYRAPAATYDPVHGDLHGTSARPYTQNYGSYGGYSSGYGNYGGSSYGW